MQFIVTSQSKDVDFRPIRCKPKGTWLFLRLPLMTCFPALSTCHSLPTPFCWYLLLLFAAIHLWFALINLVFVLWRLYIKQFYLSNIIAPLNSSCFLSFQFVAVDAGSRISFGSESDKAPYDLPFGVRIAWPFPHIALPQAHSTNFTFCFFSHALEPLIASVSTSGKRWSLLKTGILRPDQAKYVICWSLWHFF